MQELYDKVSIFPIDEAPLDATELVTRHVTAAAQSPWLDLQKAEYVQADTHPLAIKHHLLQTHHRVNIQNTKSTIQYLLDLSRLFLTVVDKAELNLWPSKLDDIFTVTTNRFDDVASHAVIECAKSFQLEMVCQARLADREIKLAKRTTILLDRIAAIERIALRCEAESSGAIHVKRLLPSSKMYQRCEKALLRCCKTPAVVAAVFHIQNNVLIREYEKVLQQAPSEDVKGLFRPIAASELMRLFALGYHNDPRVEKTVFPFWRKRLAPVDFGPPLEDGLRFHADVSLNLSYSSETVGLIALNRVVTGQPLIRASSMQPLSSRQFGSFYSAYCEEDRSYSLREASCALPEFIYVVEGIDVELEDALLLENERVQSGLLPSSLNSATSGASFAGPSYTKDPALAASASVSASSFSLHAGSSEERTSRDQWIVDLRSKLHAEALQIHREMETVRSRIAERLWMESRAATDELTSKYVDGQLRVVDEALQCALVEQRRRVRKATERVEIERLMTKLIRDFVSGEGQHGPGHTLS
jgi:hypothetical protein